jgi:hypothetical protein
MRFLILLLFCSVTTMGLMAQEVKFGKVSKEELEQKFYPQDSTADAAVLYRKYKVYYEFDKSTGFTVVTDIHEKVKFYNKEGFQYGTISEPLYVDGTSEEKISGFKAVTYNLANGNIEKTKLKNSEVFTEKNNKYWKRKKFTMPNLNKGTIIEYQYKKYSPLSTNLDEVVLQYDIPIAYQNVSVNIPEWFIFKKRTKGYLSLPFSDTKKNGKINWQTTSRSGGTSLYDGAVRTSTTNNSVDYISNVSSLIMENTPALNEEPYVNNIENYRSGVKFELQYTKFPNSSLENYTSSWEDVVKKIYEHSEFGGQLDRKRYFKEDLPKIIEGKHTDAEKSMAIFDFVKKKMNWNELHGYYCDEGVKKAYETNTGNVADINLILVAMLKASGLKANPVLVSTRSNGVPLFPTREGFNYVVAHVDLEGKSVFLDATNKYSKPNMLPIRTINWAGRIVREGGLSESISLVPTYVSKEIILMNGTMDAEGVVEAKVRRTCKDYIAYLFRNNKGQLDEDTYLGNLEERFEGVEIDGYLIKDKFVVGKPVSETFEVLAEESSEVIGNKLYFSPLLWFSESNNPFKLEERAYPIDFGFPWQDKHILSLKLPQEYKIESIPQPINIVLPDNMGKFSLRVLAKDDNVIQVMSELTFNQGVLPAHEYPHIKEFYKKVVEKQTEKVVLSKI